MASRLRVEWLDEEGFDRIAGQWDELAYADATGAFHTHAWFKTWWRVHAEQDAEFAACAVWDGDELAAGLAYMRRPGSMQAAANGDFPFLRPLHRDREALDTLLRATLAAAPTDLMLPLIHDEGDVAESAELAARGRLTYRDPGRRGPVIDLTGTWEDYRASMKGRSHWKNLENRRRKMAREHELELRVVEPPHDLDAQLQRGIALEASGWKGAAGSSIADRPATQRFLTEVGHELAAAGHLRFSELFLDGELVAFDYSIDSGNRLYLMTIAYSESHAKLSPGLVLRHAVIERCFEIGYDAHELLGGDEPWKMNFATSFNATSNWYALRPTPGTVSRYAYRHMIRPRLRSAYRRWIKPHRKNVRP